ncbi:lysoplasmalogenase family protein [Rhodococcus pyridinivorans]|nr:lysoplasmalogenase family protein [Rhodococcus pyridinivorans]WMM74809.1 lysoplasmalogenase family protein [Rhodococcus pyridinivorans]
MRSRSSRRLISFQVLAPDSAFTDVSQWFLMPLLALGLVLVTSAPRDRLVVGTLVALGVSWLGDSAPDLVDGDAAFLMLVGLVLCAQLTYIVAFRPHRRSSVLRTRPWVVGLYTFAVFAMVAVCASAAGILVVPVAIYASCVGE